MFERALSAAGAAFVSAIIVNPLDVAKVGRPPGHPPPSPSPPSSPVVGEWSPCGLVAKRVSCFSRMQTRLQAQAAGVLYHYPPQVAALGPDAVRSPISFCVACGVGFGGGWLGS